MKRLKTITKWLILFVASVFIILSITPYLFKLHNQRTFYKPYTNSRFFEWNTTQFHYRLFIPRHIKHKVILIHGFSASSFSFRHTIDSLLSVQSLVVTIDLPAFGFSDKNPDANYTDSNTVNAIHVLLNSINKVTNANAWHCAGHSMGAGFAGKLCSKFPEQIQSLIFIDGLPMKQEHTVWQAITLYPPLLRWSDVILEKKFLNQTAFSELLSSAYSKPADSVSVSGYLQPFYTSGSGSAILRMFAHTGFVQTDDSIINQKKQLIIWGKNDSWIPLSALNAYPQNKNQSRYIIDGAGHCPMETHPEAVNKLITDFISTFNE